MLAAVILSGGASQRMGSPKALLPYQGRPFLEHLIDVTRHPKIGARRVVLGAHAEPIASAVKLAADEIVINEEWETGQLSSVQAAIRSLPAGTDGLILCLIDHPLISAALVNDLIEQYYQTGMKIVLPVFQGMRGHPVIFSSTLYAELLRAPADKGARAVVWAHSAEVAEMPTTEQGCVLNLNDPDTLQRAIGGPD
jgi:molybdenum cofactor cytidylyltransferase